MCLIYFFVIAKHDKIIPSDMTIIIALIIEHFYAYLSGYFRKWEIEKYG